MLKGQQGGGETEDDFLSSSSDKDKEDDDDEESIPKISSKNKRKKMDDTTDEEERRKAERRAANRAAASRSRQRCKNTIVNLQNSVECLSKENKELHGLVNQLRSSQETLLLENQLLKRQLSSYIGLATPHSEDLLRSCLQSGGGTQGILPGMVNNLAAAASPSAMLLRGHDIGGMVGSATDGSRSVSSDLISGMKGKDGDGGTSKGSVDTTSTIKDYLENARLAELAASTSAPSAAGGALNNILDAKILELGRRNLQDLAAQTMTGQTSLSSLSQLQNNFGLSNEGNIGSGQLQLQQSTLSSIAAAAAEGTGGLQRAVGNNQDPEQGQKMASTDAASLLGRYLQQPPASGATTNSNSTAQALEILSQNQYLNSLLASTSNPSASEPPEKPS